MIRIVSFPSRLPLAAALFLGLVLAVPASAENSPKRLAANKSWTAYTYREKKSLICYLVGNPARREPARPPAERKAGAKKPADTMPAEGGRNASLLVTHDTVGKTRNVVSLVPGYAFKEGSSATLAVGGKSFEFFTKGDRAWARDAATDKAVVEAMRKGKEAVVKGAPVKGPATTDTYILSGFAPTMDEIDKACPPPKS